MNANRLQVSQRPQLRRVEPQGWSLAKTPGNYHRRTVRRSKRQLPEDLDPSRDGDRADTAPGQCFDTPQALPHPGAGPHGPLNGEAAAMWVPQRPTVELEPEPVVGHGVVALTAHSSAGNQRTEGNTQAQSRIIQGIQEDVDAACLRTERTQELFLIEFAKQFRRIRPCPVQDRRDGTEVCL